MRFPRLAHRSAAAHKLHSTPQQDRMYLISGKGETSSRLPAFSLFLPGPVQTPGTVAVYSRETGMDRHAANHYPVMKDEQIKAVSPPAAEDCVLFLWSTRPKLQIAITELLPAWRFTYKSCYTWDKGLGGTGYWFIDDSELLIVATRGNAVAPAFGTQERSVIKAPVLSRGRRKHSAKPAVFAEMIERYYPTTPKLEMFARGPARAGWDVWGNEAG
jgi:N6-adenosine-specific RNA methylase IME4